MSPQFQSKQGPKRHRTELQSELWVLEARSGKREAFAHLVEHWQERLWRHAYRLTGQHETAWDVMQESWMGIARGIKKLREPRTFERWAFQIVTRLAIAQYRRNSPVESLEDKVVSNLAAPDPADGQREEAIAALRQVLGQLGRDDRALVCLHYLEGFELVDLAALLEIPEGTVKSRLHRIRKQLKKSLEPLLS